MSDHIDGPRAIADPAIDVTDLFAFTKPGDVSRLVLVADVFPFAGESGVFSNAARYSIVVKHVKVLGLGKQAKFVPFGQEVRFLFQFDTLKQATTAGQQAKSQVGTCTLPNGEVITLLVGDEAGAYSQDRSTRVFAGVRSDPFYIGILPDLKSVPNYLQDDNVMGLVVELNIEQFLSLQEGSLFGVIAETRPKQTKKQAHEPPPYDWVGRPEQTNYIINALPESIDLRDLWNQLNPFEVISGDLAQVFKKRLTDSFEFWDMRDGIKNWDADLLNAHVNVRMDDFLLIDVSKPVTDTSHMEIEQSTIAGNTYQTGGGRTLNANVIEILVNYLVNRNQGKQYQGEAQQATQLGLNIFPYLAPANKKLLKISHQVDLLASPADVWKVVGQFSGQWSPLIASIQTIGSGIGQLREIETIDGKTIIERLESLDQKNKTLTYSLVSGVPAKPYIGSMQVTSNSTGSRVDWTVQYRPSGQAELIVHLIIDTMLERSLKSLMVRFGTPK